jgi:hypothetical protein
MWIPSQVGFSGNEVADGLARQAVESGTLQDGISPTDKSPTDGSDKNPDGTTNDGTSPTYKNPTDGSDKNPDGTPKDGISPTDKNPTDGSGSQ